MHVTRRQLLALAGACAAASAVGSGALLASWWDRPAGVGFRVLSTEEAAFLSDLAAAAFPATKLIPVAGDAMGLDHFFDEMLSHMEPIAARELRLLVHAMDSWPVPLHAHTFRGLSDVERRQVLAEWLDHDVMVVRSAVMGLMALLGMGYSLHPDAVAVFNTWHMCGFGR